MWNKSASSSCDTLQVNSVDNIEKSCKLYANKKARNEKKKVAINKKKGLAKKRHWRTGQILYIDVSSPNAKAPRSIRCQTRTSATRKLKQSKLDFYYWEKAKASGCFMKKKQNPYKN